MREFEIPIFYISPLISKIKKIRQDKDPRKRDYSPTLLDFGPVRFLIARHFGFCYGVENAIEISYKALEENPDRRIFLLSEMIHNPEVNNDLKGRGVKFIMDTSGNQLINWDDLNNEDVVIIPAFGTTIEIQKKLLEIGLNTLEYDTTCPFVEKVWNRASMLGESDFTIIVHGKHKHEETRATFSHSKENAPTIIVRDIEETRILGKAIKNEISKEEFNSLFNDKFSEGFDLEKDLLKIGVVNQTTMLATETEAIAEYLKNIMVEKFGIDNIREHFADTRDTLCYATHDNQRATLSLLEEKADLAIVVGGYNSSNTSHIVELCREKLPTYFVSSAKKIISKDKISHFNLQNKLEITSENYLDYKNPVTIILTSGASCPDSIVEEVMNKLLSFFENVKSTDEVISEVVGNV
jgi:4-hydroxy-3-methylbut-2-enyl diphosphate reductase